MRLDKKELDKCSDILSKEQLIKVGHMSKRTASYLLESKLLPAKYTGKKSRCYQIKKKDIIDFFYDYSVMPEKYATPPKWYSEKKRIRTHSYRRGFKPTVINKKKSRKYYVDRLAVYDDVLSVAQVSEFTGYRLSTIRHWINEDKLDVIKVHRRYIVPQDYLLDWITSDEYNNIVRKSRKHTSALWGVCK